MPTLTKEKQPCFVVIVAGLFYAYLKNEKKRKNEISKMRNFSKIRTTGFQNGDIFLQDTFSFGTEFSNSYSVFQSVFQGCRINCQYSRIYFSSICSRMVFSWILPSWTLSLIRLDSLLHNSADEIISSSLRITIFSMVFLSSRTFPGQLYSSSVLQE